MTDAPLAVSVCVRACVCVRVCACMCVPQLCRCALLSLMHRLVVVGPRVCVRSKERLYEYAAAQDHPVELDPVELKKAHIKYNRERAYDLGFTDPAKPPSDYDLCITTKNGYKSMYASAQVGLPP